MNPKVTWAFVVALVGAALLGAAWLLPSTGLAGGPTIPSDPQKPMPMLHRHYIVLPDGSTRPVGPDWCDNQDDPAIKLAFYNFHWNVHQGALGLQNGTGTEIYGHKGCDPIPTTGPPATAP